MKKYQEFHKSRKNSIYSAISSSEIKALKYICKMFGRIDHSLKLYLKHILPIKKRT